jgi:hypothetical protein
MAGTLAAIDVQHLAGHERRAFEIEHRIDNVSGLAHAAHRMQLGEEFATADRASAS